MIKLIINNSELIKEQLSLLYDEIMLLILFNIVSIILIR